MPRWAIPGLRQNKNTAKAGPRPLAGVLRTDRCEKMEKRIIGVTGGVGAGKSRVLRILKEDFGAHVILADDVARALMEPGQECYRRVVAYLGDSIVREDGTIDRAAMAALIFGDERKRLQVNRLTHPAVWQAVREEAERSSASVVVIEAAILGQEFRDNCQEMWYVYTSREKRLQRLAENRGYSAGKSRSIMDSQATEAEFEAFCDRKIDNNGTLGETRRQIHSLLTE